MINVTEYTLESYKLAKDNYEKCISKMSLLRLIEDRYRYHGYKRETSEMMNKIPNNESDNTILLFKINKVLVEIYDIIYKELKKRKEV